MTDCVVRFVHSNYKQEISERELVEFFPSARNVSLDPMPLRSIFLAIAKSQSTTNDATGIKA